MAKLVKPWLLKLVFRLNSNFRRILFLLEWGGEWRLGGESREDESACNPCLFSRWFGLALLFREEHGIASKLIGSHRESSGVLFSLVYIQSVRM